MIFSWLGVSAQPHMVSKPLISTSMGLRLISGLSENTEADTSFVTRKGTKIALIFQTDTLNNQYEILKTSKQMEAYI